MNEPGTPPSAMLCGRLSLCSPSGRSPVVLCFWHRKLSSSDVPIESSGGACPVRRHGHRKRDAVEMRRLIEAYQSDYYRGHGHAD